jgi:alpha-L-arabinofuranosidase
VLPSIAGTNHTPQRQTFANLLLSALEWHEMIRNSDVFEMAAFHNFSFYISPQTLHSEPVNYRTNLYKELSPLAGGYCVPVDNSTFPTYNQERNILDIGVQKNVPEIDIAAVLKDGFLYLSCVNSSPSEQREVSLKYLGVKAKAISGNTYTATLPYAKNLWSQRFECTVVPAATNGTMDVTLPPLSYTMLKITVEK